MNDEVIDPHTEGFPYERAARERRLLEALHTRMLRNIARADEVNHRLAALLPEYQPLRLPQHPSPKREDDPNA